MGDQEAGPDRERDERSYRILRRVFGTQDGVEALDELLDICGYWEPSFSDADRHHRNVAVEILRRMSIPSTNSLDLAKQMVYTASTPPVPEGG
jgi:hypothetical protein